MNESFVAALQALYEKAQKDIDIYRSSCIGSVAEKAELGAKFQWALIVRLLAEFCQYGSEKEVREITDGLAKSLIEVCFKK